MYSVTVLVFRFDTLQQPVNGWCHWCRPGWWVARRPMRWQCRLQTMDDQCLPCSIQVWGLTSEQYLTSRGLGTSLFKWNWFEWCSFHEGCKDWRLVWFSVHIWLRCLWRCSHRSRCSCARGWHDTTWMGPGSTQNTEWPIWWRVKELTLYVMYSLYISLSFGRGKHIFDCILTSFGFPVQRPRKG